MEHKSVAKIISWNIDCEAICASAAKISTTSGNAIEIFEKCKSNPQNTDLVKNRYRTCGFLNSFLGCICFC